STCRKACAARSASSSAAVKALAPLALAARGAAAARTSAALLLLQTAAHLSVGGLLHLALLLRRLHVGAALGRRQAAHRLLHRRRVRVRGDRLQLLDRRRQLGVLPLDRLRRHAREEAAHE